MRIDGSTPFSLDEFLVELIRDLQSRLAPLGAETAHLKTIGLWEGAYGVANLVSSFTAPELSVPSGAETSEAQIVVNARVAMDPADLERLVRAAVADTAGRRAAVASIATIQSFRPGRPVPTHRVT